MFASNHRAVRTYEKVGFEEIGRRRQSYFADGRMRDAIWMDCLASEFEGNGSDQNR